MPSAQASSTGSAMGGHSAEAAVLAATTRCPVAATTNCPLADSNHALWSSDVLSGQPTSHERTSQALNAPSAWCVAHAVDLIECDEEVRSPRRDRVPILGRIWIARSRSVSRGRLKVHVATVLCVPDHSLELVNQSSQLIGARFVVQRRAWSRALAARSPAGACSEAWLFPTQTAPTAGSSEFEPLAIR